MNRKQRIKKILLNQFKDFSIKISDNSHLHKGHNNFNGKNETHIKISLKCSKTYKLSRLDIHRKINKLLKDEFNAGLHSLEIKIN